ncbi:MAG: hypothetical protein EDM03_04655 [Porphyrobacter sp. IPPAS B-1204]|nr:MAG: hypothetical protein EDM03_04655 [Porphyrobacter sp. IPPAS B-1204]
MSQPRAPLRRVVVIGGGQLGVLAAIAVRRALPGCEVVVVGTPASPAAFADTSPTAMPFTNKLHDRLGIAEADIVTKAGGSYRLVTRYVGWGGAGQSGVMAYGEALDPALKTAFARDWGQVRLPGGTPAPAGSVAQVLAEAGRFAPPPAGRADTDILGRLRPALAPGGLSRAADRAGRDAGRDLCARHHRPDRTGRG